MQKLDNFRYAGIYPIHMDWRVAPHFAVFGHTRELEENTHYTYGAFSHRALVRLA